MAWVLRKFKVKSVPANSMFLQRLSLGLQDDVPSTPQSELSQQLQAMRRERDSVRSSNVSLQTELDKFREQVSALQSQGSSLHSQFSVSETTKSVTNKVFHLRS